MTKIKLVKDNISLSLINVFSDILTGCNNPIIPITKQMFAMFDPSMLPIDIPMSPVMIAFMETVSSGNEVVTDKSKKHIVNSPIFVILAILTEDFMTVWDDFESMNIEIAKMKISENISILSF